MRSSPNRTRPPPYAGNWSNSYADENAWPLPSGICGAASGGAAVPSAIGDGVPAFSVKAGLIRNVVAADIPAIIIGDTEVDVMAATALGYPSIAVSSGSREREILEQQEPTYLVDDLSGVEGALRSAGAL